MNAPKPFSQASGYRVCVAGRNRLLHWDPAGFIGTPEKQVFFQVFDTPLKRTVQGEVIPGLATPLYDSERRCLDLALESRVFHDGSRIDALAVQASLQKSARKLGAALPEVTTLLLEHLSVLTPARLRFENVSAEILQDLLSALCLVDFGIHKVGGTEASDQSPPVIGSGPYRWGSQEEGRIILLPHESHPEVARAFPSLEFIFGAAGGTVGTAEALLESGALDESLYFGSPLLTASNPALLTVPSQRANLGVLLLNPEHPELRDPSFRAAFTESYVKAVSDGAFDDTWALPRGLIPPGFADHGASDILSWVQGDPALGGATSDAPRGPLVFGVTNERQRQRLQKTLGHRSFQHLQIEYRVFANYEEAQAFQKANPTTLAGAFLAIRADRTDPLEFFEFLAPSHPTYLFQYPVNLSRSDETRNERLESSLPARIEQALFAGRYCIPVGYYFDVRILSARTAATPVLSSFDATPQILKIAPHEVLREVSQVQSLIAFHYEARQQMLRSHQEVSAFARLSHDLKAPLSALRVLQSLEHADPQIRSMLEMIGNRIDTMIQVNLRAVSDPFLQKKRVTYDLSKLLQELARELTLRAPAQVRVVVEAPEDDSIRVRVPECDLASILGNLGKNSLEAMGQGSGVISLRLEQKVPLVVSVSDEGPGFSPEHLGTLGLTRLTTKPTGSGMGLLQARSVLRQLGGDLKLENRESRGAKVTVRLPAAVEGRGIG